MGQAAGLSTAPGALTANDQQLRAASYTKKQTHVDLFAGFGARAKSGVGSLSMGQCCSVHGPVGADSGGCWRRGLLRAARLMQFAGCVAVTCRALRLRSGGAQQPTCKWRPCPTRALASPSHRPAFERRWFTSSCEAQFVVAWSGQHVGWRGGLRRGWGKGGASLPACLPASLPSFLPACLPFALRCVAQHEPTTCQGAQIRLQLQGPQNGSNPTRQHTPHACAPSATHVQALCKGVLRILPRPCCKRLLR